MVNIVQGCKVGAVARKKRRRWIASLGIKKDVVDAVAEAVGNHSLAAMEGMSGQMLHLHARALRTKRQRRQGAACPPDPPGIFGQI